jgi:hypothetical protein
MFILTNENKKYRINIMGINLRKIVIFLVIIISFSCSRKDNILINVDRDDNTKVFYEFENDETIVLRMILQDFEIEDSNRILLINRYYSFYTFSEISSEEAERIKHLYYRIYDIEIDPPKTNDDIIENYLRRENVDNELIEIFKNGRRNNEMITIPISSKFQYFDDKSEILNRKFPKEGYSSISEKEEYVIIEISNICFNKNMDKAILHLSVEYGTFPFTFVFTRSNYIIYQKDETWKEINRTTTWEGIS